MGFSDEFLRLFRREKPANPEPPPDVLVPPDAFRIGIESFVWRRLVDVHIRVLARSRGRDPLSVSQAEAVDWLSPHYAEIERDAFALAEAISRARAEGIGNLQEALHRTGLDHEMVDQALVYAYGQTATARKEGKR